jgi:hypothetical protein
MAAAVATEAAMVKSTRLTLTGLAVLGLFFIQRYRFLTITQFAKASGLSRHRAEDVLRSLELHGVLGHFGHVRIPGHGKTPKAYYFPFPFPSRAASSTPTFSAAPVTARPNSCNGSSIAI